MEMSLRGVLEGKPDKTVFSVTPEATVREAVKVMVEGGVGCVLVLQGDQLHGLFTERDLMCRVVGKDKSPDKVRITDVMTTEVATVPPNVTVGEAMTLCTQRRLRHLPVYEDDRLIGVVSAGDLTKAAIQDKQHTIDDLINYIYGTEVV